MSKIFFIGDTHFGHVNVIHYDKRPWDTVEEMNAGLIANWNSVVSPGDTVYHLGDFALCGIEPALSILSQLNGTIHLIRGNHDTRAEVRKAFASCDRKFEGELDGVRVFMQHVGLENWPGRKDGVIHLHGHSHHNSQREWKGRYDLSCNGWGYTPRTLEEILNGDKT
jgi:calcineurin-like phosphoesterase family protein